MHDIGAQKEIFISIFPSCWIYVLGIMKFLKESIDLSQCSLLPDIVPILMSDHQVAIFVFIPIIDSMIVQQRYPVF